MSFALVSGVDFMVAYAYLELSQGGVVWMLISLGSFEFGIEKEGNFEFVPHSSCGSRIKVYVCEKPPRGRKSMR